MNLNQMSGASVRDAMEIIKKYEGYTSEGLSLIEMYFRTNISALTFHRIYASQDDTMAWLDSYNDGNECRFVVSVEEFEGHQYLKGIGDQLRWTSPALEVRVTILDKFQNNLVYSERAYRNASIVATEVAAQYGFQLELSE